MTCGGLCPGVNNVLRGLVLTLAHSWAARGAQIGSRVSDATGRRFSWMAAASHAWRKVVITFARCGRNTSVSAGESAPRSSICTSPSVPGHSSPQPIFLSGPRNCSGA
ncbi:uncharacterized protein SOCE26_025960 [Sorangium cellulosum]|uniref:Uncharacterized protein n=1 Tax=Sorangium cellulosum TaxID=56 RepID=A0A2L0EPH4_SORCE|nr:uncharacterized protein SOCE26_025960 [Sorangium cellulosum]